jgi:hypothetical protein
MWCYWVLALHIENKMTAFRCTLEQRTCQSSVGHDVPCSRPQASWSIRSDQRRHLPHRLPVALQLQREREQQAQRGGAQPRDTRRHTRRV